MRTLSPTFSFKTRQGSIGKNQHLREVYNAEMERQVLLASLDRRWKEHLHEMDYLKSGIGLWFRLERPHCITEYRQEGYELFHLMFDTVKEETTKYVFYIHPHTVRHSLNRDDIHETGIQQGIEIAGIKPIDPYETEQFFLKKRKQISLFFNLDEVDKMLGKDEYRRRRSTGDVPGFEARIQTGRSGGRL